MSVTSLPMPDQQEMQQLITIARQAITDHFAHQHQLPELSAYPAALRQLGACFVTLEVDEHLQGCLGTLIPQIPLLEEVYNKAQATTCQDHRFSPLKPAQLPQLTIEVSVLSPLQPLKFHTEPELESYLETHHVGVILTDPHHRAVFLPQVWEQLPTARQFLRHLKIKGGWPAEYWSATIETDIFTVTSSKAPYQS